VITAIVQARLGSSRLPGKIFKEIAGRKALDLFLDRIGHVAAFSRLVIATTTSPTDDAIVAFASARGVPCFRGSENDLLDRYYQTVRSIGGAEHLCRVTPDCVMLDVREVDRVGRFYLANLDKYAFVHSGQTFPEGLGDSDFFSFRMLEEAWREAVSAVEREHITQFFLRRPERFPQFACEYPRDLGRYRVVLDEPQDLVVMRALVDALGAGPEIGIERIVAWLDAHPEVRGLNESVIRNEGLAISVRREAEAKKAQDGTGTSS
jgi:spore coat polysaccharide biosynthesis protein SpsF (cytidylyltransferase family)